MATSQEGRMNHGRILVVDDDAGVRDSIRLVLAKAGYDVLIATNGQEALDLMEHDTNAASVSTLLCDLEMPHMSGTELIGVFHPRYPTIPIIVLSGADAVPYTDAIVKQGVSDWIRKPATSEMLLEKVRVGVRLHALRQKEQTDRQSDSRSSR
jgi:FixJ family two-component response regulator